MRESELLRKAFSAQYSKNSDGFQLQSRHGTVFAGVSSKGHPSLVVQTTDAPRPAGRLVGKIRQSFPDALEFEYGDATWSSPGAILECLQPELLDTFIVLGGDVIRQLGDHVVAPSEVIDVVRSWDDLLRNIPRMSDERVRGLWGELSLLLEFPDRRHAVDIWQGSKGLPHDFAGGGLLVECKTSLRQLRHRVAHEQTMLQTAGESVAYLASLWIAVDPVMGRSLPELIRAIESDLQDNQAFVCQVREAGYRHEDSELYQDKFRLMGPMRFFAMEDVPRVHGWDPGVSSLRYDVDLSAVQALNQGEVAEIIRRMAKGAEA